MRVGNRPTPRPRLPRPPSTSVNIVPIGTHTPETESDPTTHSPKIVYFNAQSVRNKTCVINDVVQESGCDICFITESWLKDHGDEVVFNELKPPLYDIFSHPRASAQGGGICIIFKDHLKLKSEALTTYASFECLKVTVFNRTILCLYHPPPSSNNISTHTLFMKEFQNLLESDFLTNTNRLLILGDFNLHFGSTTDRYSRKAENILLHHSLTQHVSLPTHNKGHILDWVISNDNHPIGPIKIEDKCIADHFVMSFSLFAECPVRPQCAISGRNIRAVNAVTFASDVKEGLVTAPTTNCGATQHGASRHP